MVGSGKARLLLAHRHDGEKGENGMEASRRAVAEEIAEVLRNEGAGLGRVDVAESARLNGAESEEVTIWRTSRAGASYGIGYAIDRVLAGERTARDVAEEILEDAARDEASVYRDAGMLSKGWILERVFTCVCNRARNSGFLEGVPHVDFLDLSAYYRVRVGEDSTFVLNDDVMAAAGISIEEAASAASENDARTGYRTAGILDVLGEVGVDLGETAVDAPKVLVVSSLGMAYGASAMAHPDVLQGAAERLGGRCVILPSSIHEVLMVSADDLSGADAARMVGEVNSSVVAEEDFLSDGAYFYDPETRTLSMAEAS